MVIKLGNNLVMPVNPMEGTICFTVLSGSATVKFGAKSYTSNGGDGSKTLPTESSGQTCITYNDNSIVHVS